LEEGLRSVAAPVVDGSGRVVAALNVAVNASRRSAGSVESDVVPLLLGTARAISLDLAGVPG
jgi:IclR family transcriptional regulator, pca regulon regulatory protein